MANMIETFTAEKIAEIASDPHRVPSSNDLFVRYEDHMQALSIKDPIQHIIHAMSEVGMTNKDLYDIFGSKARVSEVLNYKRPLQVKHIRELHYRLGIPLDVLMQPYVVARAALGDRPHD